MDEFPDEFDYSAFDVIFYWEIILKLLQISKQLHDKEIEIDELTKKLRYLEFNSNQEKNQV